MKIRHFSYAWLIKLKKLNAKSNRQIEFKHNNVTKWKI